MCEVTRYDIAEDSDGDTDIWPVPPHLEGRFVKHEDYADLQQKLDAVVAENAILKSAFDKPQAYLSWHAIPPTWSDPGGGGEYLAVHDTSGHTNDDGTDCWPVYAKPEIETPTTNAILNAVRADGVRQIVHDAEGYEKQFERDLTGAEWRTLVANYFSAFDGLSRPVDATKGGSYD